MSIDRRQHNRISVPWPARVGKKGLGIANAQLQDVSLGGLFLETTLAIETGDHVLLEMQATIGGQPQRILAEGKIMRKETRPDGFGYGIQFTRISDAAVQQLLTLIANQWQPS
jgi:Tfp pilus assembly protein PilZ